MKSYKRRLTTSDDTTRAVKFTLRENSKMKYIPLAGGLCLHFSHCTLNARQSQIRAIKSFFASMQHEMTMWLSHEIFIHFIIIIRLS